MNFIDDDLLMAIEEKFDVETSNMSDDEIENLIKIMNTELLRFQSNFQDHMSHTMRNNIILYRPV